MGSVYEAQHAGTGRRVAIKVISTGDVAKDAQLVGRFQREAKAAGAIDTQHICQVLDTGTDPESGLPFMVMEFMNGEDVAQLFQRVGVISVDLALRIVAQTCLGLQKAHEASVVHRDIKPANLFLAKRDGDEVMIKLLDFGIAKVKMEHASSTADAGLTRTGTMLGSPLYMSPEQARGTKTIDHRADIWSLGIVLYQSLTGRTPYHHIDALGELIIAICSEPPKPVQDFAPWVSKDVAAIVHKALRADPAERFQTAQEMYDEVKRLLPNGISIQQEMLVGIGDAERSNVASKLTVPPPQPAPTHIPVPSNFPPSMTGNGPVSADTGGGSNGTNDGVATERAPDRRNSNAKFIVAGAFVGIAGAALVAWRIAGGPAQAGPVASATALPATSTTVTVPAVSTGTAAALPQITPTEERTQQVTIIPDEATVTVDGKPVTVKRGVITITGMIGTNHRVHVSFVKNGKKLEDEVPVSITQDGPNPPNVQLDLDTGLVRPSLPGPGIKPPPAPTLAPKAPDPGIETHFGND
jgi:serine/threonine-protein kinase